jgi:hypothetical protein
VRLKGSANGGHFHLETYVVALSCRGRRFCPSREKKKQQLLWAEWLREELLLPMAHRHVVLTIPRLLRPLLRPSSGKRSPAQQREFVERLPALMEHVRTAVLAWPLLHGVPESLLRAISEVPDS